MMPKPAAPIYCTMNWPEYNSALKRRGSLEIWFDPQLHWLSRPCGRPGRPMRFLDSAIELCLTLKSLFNLPLRQVTGLAASLIKLAGLDCPVPDYTTLYRRQKTLAVELGGPPSSGGLRLLVDSTGIKMTGGVSGRRASMAPPTAASGARCIWGSTREHWISGPSKSRRMPSAMRRRCRIYWCRSRRTSRYSASAEMALTIPEHVMLPLLNVVPMRSSRSAATANHGRKTVPASMPAIKRYALQSALAALSGRSGAAITVAVWLRPKMHCFKLLSQRVVARTFDRQITELKVRAAILSRFSKIATPVTVRIA